MLGHHAKMSIMISADVYDTMDRTLHDDESLSNMIIMISADGIVDRTFDAGSLWSTTS